MGTAPELLTATIAVGLLVLVMRWAFRPSHRSAPGPRVDATDAAELGLLDVVATRLPRAEAMAVRARLGEQGLRSSMSSRRDGTHDVLVFHDDAATARRLLA